MTLLRLFPVPVQTVAGIPFTLCTELLIIPCAGTILYAVAQMKYRGEVFDVSNKGKIGRFVVFTLVFSDFNFLQHQLHPEKKEVNKAKYWF